MPSSLLYSVHFVIPCDDSYYYHEVWLHGVTVEQAENFVQVAQMCQTLLEDISMVGFGKMPDFDASWTRSTHPDGRLEYWKNHEHHIFTLVAQQRTAEVVGGIPFPT